MSTLERGKRDVRKKAYPTLLKASGRGNGNAKKIRKEENKNSGEASGIKRIEITNLRDVKKSNKRDLLKASDKQTVQPLRWRGKGRFLPDTARFPTSYFDSRGGKS